MIKFKRTMALLVVICMTVIMLPMNNVFADSLSRSYKFVVKTADVANAGTNSKVYLGFEYYNSDGDNTSTTVVSKHVDDPDAKDDHERNDTNNHVMQLSNFSPWMIKNVYLETDGGGAAPGWAVESIGVCTPLYHNSTSEVLQRGVIYYNDLTGSNGGCHMDKGYFWIDGGSIVKDFSVAHRGISSVGGFNNWGGTYYVNKSTTGSLSYSWDRNITDQYGTYNPWLYDDAPTMTISSTNSKINSYNFTAPSAGSKASFSLNYNSIYKQMESENIGKVTFTLKLTFPSKSTYGNNNFTKTVTIYRRSFEFGTPSISTSPVFTASADNNYFNTNNREVSISFAPTTIHYESADTAQKTTLATNFSCNAALYNGNTTSTKVCDLDISKSGTNIILKGTIPNNIDTNDNGLRLQMTNVSSKYDNQVYNLNSGSTDYSYYFSKYKADTTKPSVFFVNSDGSTYNFNNNYQKSHKFWMTSSEELYAEPTATRTAFNARLFTYGLYRKNIQTNTYATSATKITGYTGSGSNTSVMAPIATSILTQTPINLATADTDEGVFRMKLVGYDEAGNALAVANSADIILDSKAPVVSVEVTNQNQAVDFSKSVECKFTVSDFANNYPSISDIWSRVYYCFVKNGEELPAINEATAESGKLDTVLGKWAFFEGGSSTSTAMLKIARGGSYDGKLYYYGKDSCGNTSTMLNKAISIRNDETADTISFTTTSYYKGNYDISFSTDNADIQTTYQWVSKDADVEFTQQPVVYKSGDDVGAASHIDINGNTVLFNGVYTLKYETKNILSGNTKQFEQIFVFDNKAPEIEFAWKTDNSSPKQRHQAGLNISDVSGLEKATYRIVDANGNNIEGCEETELPLTENFDETMCVSETPEFSMPKSGAYKIKFYAKDKNGYEQTVTPENSLFVIRCEKNEIAFVTDNVSAKVNDLSIINDNSYTVSVKISEPMLCAGSVSKEQTASYQISTNGIDYSEWVESGITLTKGSDKLSGTIVFTPAVTLHLGTNNIYIKTAIKDNDTNAQIDTQSVSDAVCYQIIYDNVAPSYQVDYSETERTTADVTATITLSDEQSGMKDAVFSIDNNMQFEKVSDSKYTVVFSENKTAKAKIIDCAGNSAEIALTVSNIDKAAPEALATVQQITDGDRTDADITVTIKDVKSSSVKFGLVTDANDLEKAYSDFAEKNVQAEKTESESSTVSGETNDEYVIHARGFDGTYKIAVYAEDILGNKISKVLDGTEFTIIDAASQLVSSECSPSITKSSTIAHISFNTSVAVLPDALATGATDDDNIALAMQNTAKEFKDSFELRCLDATEKKIFAVDKCGRGYVFTFTPDATFIEGFMFNSKLFKNDAEIDASKFTSFKENDVIKLEVYVNAQYASQYFMTENAIYQGFTLDETLSEKNESGYYTKMVFFANHNASKERFVKFDSYTEEGNEDDRIQNEQIFVDTLDETAPVISAQYSTTVPTNNNVSVSVSFSDAESGISKVEVKTGSAYETLNVSSPFNVEFSENGTKYVRVTNHAGIEAEYTLTVSNIDKVPVAENVHYTVKYLYENYLGEWTEITDGNYYRKVKAVISPVGESTKTLRITNNNGSFEKLLTDQENQFVFSIADNAENTCTQNVAYDSYDNEAGTTTWSLSTTKKTNQPVTAFVTIEDEINDIAYAVVTDSKGNVYSWNQEIIGNERSVVLPNSDIYTVTAYDAAGNMWSEDITVSNINKVLPEIIKEKVVYSTPQGTITAKSVNVTVSQFSKDNVSIIKVEPENGLSQTDISFAPGSSSVRFKKNGSVSVEFMDDYGNIGKDVLSVGNIYSEPPQLRAVVMPADDLLSVEISFEQMTDDNGKPYDIYRELSDLYVISGGITYTADNAKFVVKSNGTYKFTAFDAAGTTQYITVDVTQIDDVAPNITSVDWQYNYLKPKNDGAWEMSQDSQKIIPSGEAGYVVATDKYQGTNQDVTVNVATDKPTKPLGSNNPYALSTSMLYAQNGLFNFNMQAKNGTTAQYGVDIQLIDKDAPIIEFDSTPELIFIEGMTEQKDSTYAYNINKLLDYHAYDVNNGVKTDLTSKVTIDFGAFDSTNINNNTFDRTNPYYIYYTVYDNVGNCTKVRRTIRLVGFYDSIALVNGNMPDGTNTISVAGNAFDVTIKNFAGISYARYAEGIQSMGQMKTTGYNMVLKNGQYSAKNLSDGWYTVYIQTDKRDYFTIWVFVSNQDR